MSSAFYRHGNMSLPQRAGRKCVRTHKRLAKLGQEEVRIRTGKVRLEFSELGK